MYLNRVSLIGFVGNDAELKSTKNETAVAVFSVATQRSWKNDRGGYDSRTEWHRCLLCGICQTVKPLRPVPVLRDRHWGEAPPDLSPG